MTKLSDFKLNKKKMTARVSHFVFTAFSYVACNEFFMYFRSRLRKLS